MTLTPGTKLGPYEILAAIGAGGMGEVYKAKDTRLDRFVAIKVLPEDFAKNPDSLARFEREAKAVAALNHTNITGIFDIGHVDDTAYAVMELLEGETLRARLLQGGLTPRKAIELAIQMAQGLAAAHNKGVIHRDLKPDNLWITTEGRLKILDFGLAKQVVPAGRGSQSYLATEAVSPGHVLHTEEGVILGTMGYMSPEQVRGETVDARSDIFSFGAVLFEMLTGRKAFARETASDTMAAILRDDPPEMDESGKSIPPALRRIIDHCLEKLPARRFHDADDLAFALENLSTGSTDGRTFDGSGAHSASSLSTPIALGFNGSWRQGWPWVTLAGLAVAAALLWIWGVPKSHSGITYRQRSFRPQAIFQAAFAPDGETIIYSAALEGNVPELFMIRPEYAEPQSLGLPRTHLLSISSKGELAVLTNARYINHRLFTGTLARVSLGGTAPREILEGVRQAAWSPDGAELAIIRMVNGKDRLEFPIGKVLLETTGYLSDLRVSPKGDRIALFEHPAQFDDRGSVIAVDRAGKRTVLSAGYSAEEGLSWSQSGDEVLFSATAEGSGFTLYGVNLSGHRRIALMSAGGLTMHDVSRTGRWLVTRDDKGWGISVQAPGANAERDLSWLDGSSSPWLSGDGRKLLFSDYSSTAGSNYQVCLRTTDGGPVTRLGEGDGYGLSPDGKWALAIIYTPPQILIHPTGPGETRRLPFGSLEAVQVARWCPDGKRILIEGNEAGKASRCFVQDVSGGSAKPVTPEGTAKGMVSPDGLKILYSTSGGSYSIQPIGGGSAQPVPGLTAEDQVSLWSADGLSLYTSRGADIPLRIERLDISSGQRVLVREVAPTNRMGILHLSGVALADDTKSYAYGYLKMMSKIFVVEGAR